MGLIGKARGSGDRRRAFALAKQCFCFIDAPGNQPVMGGKPRFLAEDGGEISGGKPRFPGKLGHGKRLGIAPYHPPQRAGDGGPGPGPCHLER